jgi:hypothetical protein
MTRTVSADSAAAPAAAWALVARPGSWHRWAPHIRGAWGLGSPEVEQGRRGVVRVLGVVPLPARIDAVDPGTSWSWSVGPVHLRHTVAPLGDGCRITMTLDGPAPVEAAYAPLVGLLTRRLARVAERTDGSPSA